MVPAEPRERYWARQDESKPKTSDQQSKEEHIAHGIRLFGEYAIIFACFAVGVCRSQVTWKVLNEQDTGVLAGVVLSREGRDVS